MKFDIDTIESLMLDIEALELPVEKHHPVLMLVLRAIEHYAPEKTPAFTGVQPIDNLPKFLEKQAAREREEVFRVNMREALQEPPEAEEAPMPEPRAAVAPQADFSPAPVPEAVRVEKRPTNVVPGAGELKIGPWSLIDEAYLMQERSKGVLFKDIAAKLNRPVKGVNQKFYNLRDAKTATHTPAAKTVGEIQPAPEKALKAKAQGGAGILPRPCPDEEWSIEDDLDLVSEHHRGLSMLDVSIMLERTKPDCIKRYNALIEAMPLGSRTQRQVQLKQTLAFHAAQARKVA